MQQSSFPINVAVDIIPSYCIETVHYDKDNFFRYLTDFRDQPIDDPWFYSELAAPGLKQFDFKGFIEKPESG